MLEQAWRAAPFLVPFLSLSCGSPDADGVSPASGGVAGAATNGGAATSAGASSTAQAGSGGVSASGGQGGSGGSAEPSAGAASSTADGTGPAKDAPQGYGQATTGGGDAAPVTVDSMSALQAAIDAYAGSGGLVLRYAGTFDFDSIADPCLQHTLPAQTVEIKNKSDITILGEPGSSGNFGFHVAAASSNLIIRNMTLGLTPGGDASDILSIEGMSSGTPSHIWIDHNELFTTMAECPGTGDTAFDGMIDVKKGADHITVSYNYLHDHHKVSLNGFTDTDELPRHITFHHNLFENIGSRAPLQRHGFAHVVNNYFLDVAVSCVNVRMGGYALVEANFFENVKNPVTARDSDEVGFWELRDNNLASAADVAPGNRFGISWSPGDAGTVNASDWTSSAPYPEALDYALEAQPYQCIHDGLREAAGAGKALATLACK